VSGVSSVKESTDKLVLSQAVIATAAVRRIKKAITLREIFMFPPKQNVFSRKYYICPLRALLFLKE